MKMSNLFIETLFNFSNNTFKYVFMSQKNVYNNGKLKNEKVLMTMKRKNEILFGLLKSFVLLEFKFSTKNSSNYSSFCDNEFNFL